MEHLVCYICCGFAQKGKSRQACGNGKVIPGGNTWSHLSPQSCPENIIGEKLGQFKEEKKSRNKLDSDSNHLDEASWMFWKRMAGFLHYYCSFCRFWKNTVTLLFCVNRRMRFLILLASTAAQTMLRGCESGWGWCSWSQDHRPTRATLNWLAITDTHTDISCT